LNAGALLPSAEPDSLNWPHDKHRRRKWGRGPWPPGIWNL